MFGDVQGEKRESSTAESAQSSSNALNECKNECNFNGVCNNGQCYCQQPFYGDDCSKTTENRGAVTNMDGDDVIKYATLSFGVGTILGKQS